MYTYYAYHIFFIIIHSIWDIGMKLQDTCCQTKKHIHALPKIILIRMGLLCLNIHNKIIQCKYKFNFKLSCEKYIKNNFFTELVKNRYTKEKHLSLQKQRFTLNLVTPVCSTNLKLLIHFHLYYYKKYIFAYYFQRVLQKLI